MNNFSSLWSDGETVESKGPGSNYPQYITIKRFTDQKEYELKNHLGNVHEVIADRKIGVDDGGTADIDYFDAEVLSYADYYPFGWVMPGRNANSDEYRYGFNGEEKDDEVKSSTGTQYNYGFRIYDPRIAKFLSIDPLTDVYPSLTPYQFAANMPIWAIDLDGMEAVIVNKIMRPLLWLSMCFMLQREKADFLAAN